MKLGHLLIALVIAVALFFVFKEESYEIRNPIPLGDSIVCFGDSLTYGTGAPPDMSYPAQLSRMIGKPVINLGVPGNTTADALKRLPTLLEENPRLVLITLGGNDLKKRIPKEQAFANLRSIVERIQDRGALVVIGGIDIPLFGKGYGDTYEELARESGAVLIGNVFEGIFGNTNLMSDPIHPNAEGYTIMANAFYRAVKPYLR